MAKLLAREKVEARVDSNILEEGDLTKALRNTKSHGNIILDHQVDFVASQVISLKNFHEDFFDSPAKASEAKPLAKETAVAFKDRLQKLDLASQVTQYPFLTALSEPVSRIKALVGKEYNFYLTALSKQKDALREKVKAQIKKEQDKAI